MKRILLCTIGQFIYLQKLAFIYWMKPLNTFTCSWQHFIGAHSPFLSIKSGLKSAIYSINSVHQFTTLQSCLVFIDLWWPPRVDHSHEIVPPFFFNVPRLQYNRSSDPFQLGWPEHVFSRPLIDETSVQLHDRQKIPNFMEFHPEKCRSIRLSAMTYNGLSVMLDYITRLTLGYPYQMHMTHSMLECSSKWCG